MVLQAGGAIRQTIGGPACCIVKAVAAVLSLLFAIDDPPR